MSIAFGMEILSFENTHLSFDIMQYLVLEKASCLVIWSRKYLGAFIISKG